MNFQILKTTSILSAWKLMTKHRSYAGEKKKERDENVKFFIVVT